MTGELLSRIRILLLDRHELVLLIVSVLVPIILVSAILIEIGSIAIIVWILLLIWIKGLHLVIVVFIIQTGLRLGLSSNRGSTWLHGGVGRRLESLRDWPVSLGLLDHIENALKGLAKEPRVRSLLKFYLLIFVAMLSTTAVVVWNLIDQIWFIKLMAADLNKNWVTVQIPGVLWSWSLTIDQFHRYTTSCITVLLSLELILQLHDLVRARSLFGVVDQTCVEEFIGDWVINFHISYCHAQDILLSSVVLLVLIVGALKRVLLHHKVIETAAKRPNINSCGHLRITCRLEFWLFLEKFRRAKR